MLRCFTLLVVTGAVLAGICPRSHPYNYQEGNYCCKYDREKVYRPQGERCDGGPISRKSKCCKDDAHYRCNRPPCDDYANAGHCPRSHPYNYQEGNYCCKYDREKVYRPQGERCDGGPISRKSKCCKDDAHYRCGSPPCDDYPITDCSNFCDEITEDRFELKTMEYHLDQATEVERQEVRPAGVQRLNNKKGTTERSIDFTITKEVTEARTFTHTAGASVTVGTTFSAGIPFVAGGKISVSATASYSYASGKTTTTKHTRSHKFRCTSPPGRQTICTVYLNRVIIKVPYTQVWTLKRYPQCTCSTKGLYEGEDSTELYMNIDENKKK